jgi:regulatory protein
VPKRAKAGDGAGRPVPSDLPVLERREKAVAAALRLLAVRERSAAEIKARLRDKGYDSETIVFVLDGLRTHGLQSDHRFADGFAESAFRSKGVASRVVQAELSRKGIDKETAAVAATRSPDDEARAARSLAERRLGRLGSYPAGVRARRLVAFLQRRGYPPELCAAIVRELVADESVD